MLIWLEDSLLTLKKSCRQSAQLSSALRSAFQSHLHTYLYPHSTISIQVSVLSADGSLFAAAINACTLALVDAGIPMPGLLCGCTAGMSGSASIPRDPQRQNQNDDSLDPLLDLSLPEEQELPFVTVGTTTPIPGATEGDRMRDDDDDEVVDDDGDGDEMNVSVLHMETRAAHHSYLETMLAVGIDGCKQIRKILEDVVKGVDRVLLSDSKIERGRGASTSSSIVGDVV
jgi:exosome complex component RRP41